MRRFIAIALAAVMMLGLAAPASGKVSNQRKAVRAVKEAIGEEYLVFSTYPVRVNGAKVSVSCSKLSNTRFSCTWNARNKSYEAKGWGTAIAVVYKYGAEAKLKQKNCRAPYNGCA